MHYKVLVSVIAIMLCTVSCQPVDTQSSKAKESRIQQHSLWKRFINPSITYGDFSDNNMDKIRTKRSLEEECEKLHLCMLHARSSHSFLAAFQLYFVNKENARLWDHQARTRADCENRFSCYR